MASLVSTQGEIPIGPVTLIPYEQQVNVTLEVRWSCLRVGMSVCRYASGPVCVKVESLASEIVSRTRA